MATPGAPCTSRIAVHHSTLRASLDYRALPPNYSPQPQAAVIPVPCSQPLPFFGRVLGALNKQTTKHMQAKDTTDHTTPQPQTDAIKAQPAKRVWCVLKLRDYALAAWTESPEDLPDFARLGANAYLSTDREAAFAEARASGGLLCSAESLPRARSLSLLEERISELARADTSPSPTRTSLPAPRPARPAAQRKSDGGKELLPF